MRQSQCGTPLYYSPEIVKKEAYSLKIDVWSVGLLAYELIVGRVPFKIWSEFDLPIILKQEVSIPDYVDFSE
jgi:serine/threonine protein kinase